MGLKIKSIYPGDRPFFAKNRFFMSARSVRMSIGGIEGEVLKFRVYGKRI